MAVDTRFFSLCSAVVSASSVTCSDRHRQKACGSPARHGGRDSHGTAIGVSVSCHWSRRSRCVGASGGDDPSGVAPPGRNSRRRGSPDEVTPGEAC